MSKTVAQIYAANPTTVVADTDLYYLVQSPYTPGADAAITGASLKAAFGTGGTVNPGLINQLAWYAASGSTISGLSTLANGTLITSAGGAPSISQTLPAAVQGNITALGTIASGIWNATTIATTVGGTGLTSYALGDTIYASAANVLSKLAGNTTATKNFLTQTGTGVVSAAPIWGTISASDIGSGAALTKVDDTNVTLTLGGTPSTALLVAASLTLGWTGTLSGTRGGTGVNNGANTITLGGSISTAGAHTLSGAFASTFTFTNTTTVTFPTSGTLATTSQLPTPAALTKTDDTNVTLTLGGTPATALLQATSLTLGWTGQLSLTRGGSNASLVASNGGIVWSNASQMQILSGTATANQILLSGASATPSWSTTTYPATNAINTIMYASSANVLGVIAAVNGGVLVSNNAGVPSMLANPAAAGKVLQSANAAIPAWSTPTYPSASGTSRKILISDGTNNVYSTETYATPGSSGNVMTSDGTNWTSAAPSATSQNPFICTGRLTLTTATPVTTSDVTAATSVFFTPYTGNEIALFDGSSTWTTLTFTEITISVPATTSTMYDVFIFNSSGTATAETLAWTNDTTRATALVLQNGVYVKSGATTRRYIGSFRTTTVSGQTEDSFAKRYVWNYANRVIRPMKAIDATDTWTYSTATYRQANASTANQLDMVIGVSEDEVTATVTHRCVNSTATIRGVCAGIGLDVTNATSATIFQSKAITSTQSEGMFAFYNGFPAAGRHFLAWLEIGAGADTQTWAGDNGTPTTVQSGISGFLKG